MKHVVITACLLALGLLTLHSERASAAAPSDPWVTYAECAAAYKANWLDRLSDSSRPHSMSVMIQDQSKSYENVAVSMYRRERNLSLDGARQAIERFMGMQMQRFKAMDKGDELNKFIDHCPQLSE